MVKNKIMRSNETIIIQNEDRGNEVSTVADGDDMGQMDCESESEVEVKDEDTEFIQPQHASSSITTASKLKKRKKGIIYVSNIPKHMNVTRIREILGQYGEIGRVYLQPETKTSNAEGKKKKKRKSFARHFTEGWVEFQSKRVAKQVAEMLNNKQISSRKRSQFYDYLWSIKYLPRFKWVHLSERLNYERAVHKQRMMTEVSQARKEAAFFQNNLDKSELLRKKSKKNKMSGID